MSNGDDISQHLSCFISLLTSDAHNLLNQSFTEQNIDALPIRVCVNVQMVLLFANISSLSIFILADVDNLF